MKENSGFNVQDNFLEKDYDFKKEFFKYFYYWKYFVGFTLVLLLVSFTYLRYTSKIYQTNAKIKIIDKRESSLELPSASEIFSNSKINLENEMEVLKSEPILNQVAKNLRLETSVYGIGDIKESLVVSYPFDISLKVATKELKSHIYKIMINDLGFSITNLDDEKSTYLFKQNSTLNVKHNLPFEITNFDKKLFLKNLKNNKHYEIRFSSTEKQVDKLKKIISISQIGKQSDIIKLNIQSSNPQYGRNVLNELIKVFDNDGIKDRRLVHKRTIDFVNERYAFLSLELDSIEVAKQIYKAKNDLVDFSANSQISLEQSIQSEENIFSLENQISITNLLIESLSDSKLELLPAKLGINNTNINALISDYNQKILDRKKLLQSAGTNNPSLKQLDIILSDARSNIIFSLKNNLVQLKELKLKVSGKFDRFDNEISNLPEKEKILRAIERNQTIKESLYLYLLQKREEAEVSYAVTEPSIKVVEYAISENKPSFPRRNVIFFGALIFGFGVPFGWLYLLFMFNNKIYSKEQFQDLNLPIKLLGEIPEIKDQPNTTIMSSSDRSPLAESFRVLASNLKFFEPVEKKSKVIMVTSTIKGEGKTFTALNLAYSKSALGNKVLLIGADLHNPQIHTYLNIEKNVEGLTDVLIDNKLNWKKMLKSSARNLNCDILIAGRIPPNPAELLNNGNFDILLEKVKKSYDYVIVDTPPCLLVSDTLSIISLADISLFVVRCNHTSIQVLDFIRDCVEKGTIGNNSMMILNGLGANNRYGYGYSYNYNYGYKYKYSYNYNYGYGYEYKSDN